jgi:hypothetical protein
MTRPALTVFDERWSARPSLQCATESALRAFVSVRPTNRGTTHAVWNEAPTATSPVSETVHDGVVPAGAQEPLQPAKRDPRLGVARSVTVDESGNGAMHAVPQAIPLGSL